MTMTAAATTQRDIHFCPTMYTREAKATVFSDAATIAAQLNRRQAGHELLIGPVKLYMDFETDYKTRAEQEATDAPTIAAILSMLSAALDAPAATFATLKSCGPKRRKQCECAGTCQKNEGCFAWRNSYHIVSNDARHTFDCGKTCLRFLRKHVPEGFTPDFDAAVYVELGKTHKFRAPLCFNEKDAPDMRRFMIPFANGAEVAITAANVYDFLVTAHTAAPAVTIAQYPPPAKIAFDAVAHGEYAEMFAKGIEELRKKFPDELKYFDFTSKEPSGNQLYGERLMPNPCMFCDRIHDNDSTAFIGIFGQAILYSCSRRTKSTTEADGKTPREIKPAIILSAPKAPERGDVLRDAVLADRKNRTNICDEIAGAHATIEAKYLSDSKQFYHAITAADADIIGIQSHMGTGKSYAAARIMAEPEQAEKSVLVVTMRVSLSSKYRADYVGFAHYQDEKCAKGPIAAPRAIVVMDSLCRINVKRRFDYVILDECESIITHLSARTFMAQPGFDETMRRFKAILRGARKIIAMDAGLSKYTLDTIAALRCEGDGICDEGKTRTKIHIVHNTHVPASRVIRLTHKRTPLIDMITTDLREGRRIFLASNMNADKLSDLADYMTANGAMSMGGTKPHTPEQAEAYAAAKAEMKATDDFEPILAFRRKYGFFGDYELAAAPPKTPKVLLITRKTLLQPDVIAALAAPNETWGKYDCILASPSIQSGISYDNADFDRVYGIFNNLTTGTADMLQQISRIRHPRENVIHIALCRHNNNNINIYTAADFIAKLRIPSFHTEAQLKRLDGEYNNKGFIVLTRNLFFRILAGNKLRAAADLRAFEMNFCDAAHDFGHITKLMHVPGEHMDMFMAAIEVRVKQIGTDREMIVSDILSTVKTPTDEQCAAIKAALEKQKCTPYADQADFTKREVFAFMVKKHWLMKTYGTPPDEKYTPLWMDIYADPKGRHAQYYRVLRTYRRGFADGLEQIRQFELRNAAAARIKLTSKSMTEEQRKKAMEDAGVCEDDMNEGLAAHGTAADDVSVLARIAGAKPKYERHYMLIQALERFGAMNLHESIQIDTEALPDVIGIFTSDPTRTKLIMGMSPAAIKKMAARAPDDAKYTKNALAFINGPMSAEFGIRIKRAGKNDARYFMVNEFAQTWLSEYAKPFGELTPCIHRADDDKEEPIEHMRRRTEFPTQPKARAAKEDNRSIPANIVAEFAATHPAKAAALDAKAMEEWTEADGAKATTQVATLAAAAKAKRAALRASAMAKIAAARAAGIIA